MSTRSGWIRLLFICTFLYGLAISKVGQTQVVPEARFEVEISPSANEYPAIVSLAGKGLILYAKSLRPSGAQLEVTRLDTTLHAGWSKVIAIDQNFQILLSAVNGDYLFILMRNLNTNTTSFQVAEINIAQGESTIYPVNNLIRFSVREFRATHTSFWMGGSFNNRPLVLHFHTASGEARVIPGLLDEPGELMSLKTRDDGSLDLLVGGKNRDRQRCIWLRTYDPLGNLKRSILVEPGPKKQLLSGQVAGQTKDGLVVAGTYGRFAESSRGIYSARIDESGEYQINYYLFGELGNFFSYLRPGRARRIKERVARRNLKGKKTAFSYRIIQQPLIILPSQFILVGEAFNPTYRYSSDGSAFGYFAPYRNDMIFDGYQYSHALVMGFSLDGKLLWDNSMEMGDFKTFQRESFIRMGTDESRTVIMYLHQNLLRSKVVRGDLVLESKKRSSLITVPRESSLPVEHTEPAKLGYWYATTFYASGIQWFKKPSPSGNTRNRKVFYVTKFTYP